MAPADKSRTVMEFGRFRLLPHTGEIWADGVPVSIGGRAFDLLMVLIEAHGELVTKSEILRRVWPDTVVDESNLQVQISSLRRALGEDRQLIRTISGRGYRFVGRATAVRDEPDSAAALPVTAARPHSPQPVATNLPAPTSDLIGREAELAKVVELISEHRLVTLTGAAGIGKTRLGLDAARQLIPTLADGAWLVELAPLSDPALVAVAVGGAFAPELVTGVLSPQRVANAFGSKQLLIVLDNCEHVVDAAATMAAALLRAGPGLRVLATSTEALGVEGERVYRVTPLATPAEANHDVDDVLRYGSVQLFVSRARAADPQFSLNGRVAGIVGAICRRLDGIPLAIELAAARAVTLGVEGVAARLDDRFQLLTGGRRTALPRHQTLRATLDWSYGLLADAEQSLLRRLGVFKGAFTLDAAAAVAEGGAISLSAVIDLVARLVNKSLVTTELAGPAAHYRLLETTRAYAIEKLAEIGEFDATARHHAEYYLTVLGRAEAEWMTRHRSDWVAAYARDIDNVRAALDWALGANGNAALGAALALASVPLWNQLSLLEEAQLRLTQAITSLEGRPDRAAQREMRLNAALGLSLIHTKRSAPETGAAWTRALDLAKRLEATDYQLLALWGLTSYHICSAGVAPAMECARQFCALAATTSDPADRLVGDRMTAIVLHYQGDQINARLLIERFLSRYRTRSHRSHTLHSAFDQRTLGLVYYARILWLQGLPDQAVRMAQSSIEEAQAIGHAIPMCYALGDAACPAALMVGDLEAAERFTAMLLELSAKHGFANWNALACCVKAQILVSRGEFAAGIRLLRDGLDKIVEAKIGLRYSSILAGLAHALGHSGEIREGLTIIDESLEHAERTEERWCVPEMLRIKGELIRVGGNAAAAEGLFLQAIDVARRQGAQSLQLRAAIAVARLQRAQGREIAAREVLSPIYQSFTEGFGTVDLTVAKKILDDLR